MTYTIATMRSADLFFGLILMALFVFQGGFWFTLALTILSVWLFSTTFELAKANQKESKPYTIIFLINIATAKITGLVSLITNSFNPIFLISMIILLFNMIYLAVSISSLLTTAELKNSDKKKLNALWLMYFWPIGVWYLQPRIRSVLIEDY